MREKNNNNNNERGSKQILKETQIDIIFFFLGRGKDKL